MVMLMSFDDSQTPTGELNVRRVMNPSYANLASVEYIVSNTCIADAWKKVRSNKGAPGVDKISIEQFPKWGRPKWKIIKNQVKSGTYQPMPARRVEIPKESGGIRLLGIMRSIHASHPTGQLKLFKIVPDNLVPVC